MGHRGYIFRARPGYYDRTLEERQHELRAPKVHHLCKTLLLENKNCTHDGLADVTDSKYVCVVVQYTARFSSDDLAAGLAALSNKTASPKPKSYYAFQMADEATAHTVSGYEYNGLTPFGMNKDVPVSHVVC